METSGELSLASRLCLSCGLCCDGTLYEHAKVHEGEAAQTELAGFKVQKGDRKRSTFLFPCHNLDGKCCTAYERWRPKVCSSFFCEVQKRTAAGECTETEAMGLIANALSCRAQIMESVPKGSSFTVARQRFDSIANTSEALAPEDARLVVRMFVLERFLDKHFRKPEKSRFPATHVQENASPRKSSLR